jgi:hypothetical protein
MHIFRHIFLSNHWWQKSDIWSQASYRYPISCETFLDPSDSYFLLADFVDFYTHLSYICICTFFIAFFSATIVTIYQISAINGCWEKCDEKCAYMFNVYKNQLSRQTGSRNLMGPKTLPTIWGTSITLVTKYQISAINSCSIRFLLPVCRRSWFLYTLNIYAHFSSHFSQQPLMAEIWYLVTSFI